MSTIITLRASATPRALLCPASVRGELRIDKSEEAGLLGTACHVLLARLVRTGGEPEPDEVTALAEDRGVDAEDLAFLLRKGAWLWKKLAPEFAGGAAVEVPLSATVLGIELTGHADVVFHGSRIVRGLDWKSGRKDTDYRQQMRSYCALVLLNYPEVDEAEFTLAWLRTEEIEIYRMNRVQLEEYIDELRAVVEWDGVYHPGDHCHFCPRSHECQARHALVRRDILAISDRELVARAESELALMPAESVVQLLLQADRVEKCAARVKKAIREHVDEAGRIEGAVLVLELEPSKSRTLKPLEAWPVLEEALSTEELAGCVKLSVTSVESTVAAKAGKGAGAGAVRELRRRLEEAQAIELTERRTLVAKRRSAEHGYAK